MKKLRSRVQRIDFELDQELKRISEEFNLSVTMASRIAARRLRKTKNDEIRF